MIERQSGPDIRMNDAVRENSFRGDSSPRRAGLGRIAQAILEDLVLVSSERAFDAYGVARMW
jgi:hypothetical protein